MEKVGTIRRNLWITALLLLITASLFLFFNMGNNWAFALRLRGVSSIDNFLLSVASMIGFAFLIYLLIYRKGKNNLYLLLLVGIILGTLFNSLSSFMQLLIDPSDYFIVQGKMFASFNRINRDLLWPSTIVMSLILIAGFRMTRTLDVLALGREQAINLGVSYNRMVQLLLVIIAIMVSVSTALVGPITFLGLLVTNLTYELFRTYRHSIIIAACSLVTAVTLLGGQFVMERLFNLSIPVSAIINLAGGVYFIYLLLRVKKL